MKRSFPRSLFYVCRLGTCGLYAKCVDKYDNQVTVPEGLIGELAKLGFI